MWRRKKTEIYAQDAQPGMTLVVGSKLFKIKTVEQGGAYIELALISIPRTPTRNLDVFISLPRNETIAVNNSRK